MNNTLRRALIGIGLALPFLLLFFPVLFQHRAFADGDAVLQMYPAAYALKEVLLSDQSFAWIPHILTGFPMAASFVGGFFSPLYQLLFRALDIFAVYHWLTFGNFLATAWLTYTFCRLLKLSVPSSLFAGVAFPLGTAYWLFGSNLTVTSGFPLIPGLLVVVLLLQRFEKRTTRIIISIISGGVLGLLLLQAHPQWPIMAMALAIAFAMFIDRQKKSPSHPILQLTPRANPPPSSPTSIGDPNTNNQNKKNLRSFLFSFGFLDSRFHGNDKNWILNSSLVIGHFFKTLTASLGTTYWILLTFLIGIIISLPQFSASLHIGEFSARGEGIAYSNATAGSLLPSDLLSFLLPNLNLPFIMQKPYLLYMGAVPLLLAILSFALPKSKHYRFFLWTFIVCLLIAVKYSPLFVIIHQLPVLNAFREPSRFMYIGLFAFTMIATFGFDRLASLLSPHYEGVALQRVSGGNPGTVRVGLPLERLVKWLMRFSVTLVSLVALSSITIAIWRTQLLNVLTSYFDTHLYASTTKLPLEHYHNVIKMLFDQVVNGIMFMNIPTLVGILSLLFGSLLILWYLNKQKDLSSRALTRDPNTNNQNKKNLKSFLFSFGFLDSRFHGNDKIEIFFSTGIILLTLLNGIGVKIGTIHTVPRSLLTTPPAVASILASQTNEQPYRVFSFLPGASVYQELDSKFGYHPETNIEAMKNLLVPNLSILYGIDSLDYYDDLMDRRNTRLIRYLGSNRGTYGESLADMDIPFEDKTKLFLDRLPLLSMANVKYITSLYPLEHPRLKFLTELRVTRYALQEYIYENLDVMPRYYLTDNVEMTPVLSEEDGWENLLNHKITENTNSQKTLIESSTCAALSPPYEGGAWKSPQEISSGEVKTVIPTQQTNTNYTFNLESDTDQWFIFGQNNIPGWTAAIDGQSTQIYRANFLFQSIRVPAGTHVVEWRYTL